MGAPWLALPINLIHGPSFAVLWAAGVADADSASWLATTAGAGWARSGAQTNTRASSVAAATGVHKLRCFMGLCLTAVRGMGGSAASRSSDETTMPWWTA